MELKLEQLAYQQQAIQSVVAVFNGQQRNTFDNACNENIRANFLSIDKKQWLKNLEDILITNNIDQKIAAIDSSDDLCVEMETGTGKTLVYIKTIYELYKQYAFTKFIILVPSIAIKEGVLATLNTFANQLEAIYNIKPRYFEYNSKRLAEVIRFVEEQHPQIMIMTLQSFNTEDRILNQPQREDLFFNTRYIEAIAQTRPIIIMDEPQEGMDTVNSIKRIKNINPLVKIRYSATHKILKNLIYRLTPYHSYKKGLVKKIEVLTVSEKNDEASMKIELTTIELGKGDPKAVLKLWHKVANNFKFKNTKKLDRNTKLYEVTGNNFIYRDYQIEKIAKPIRERGFVKFTNGVIVYEGDQAKDHSIIFGEQLYWLIGSHFKKKQKLNSLGIKCLSLIFIDRVNNYIQPNGIIKLAFIEQYKKAYRQYYHTDPTEEQIENTQGYYFAQTGKGNYTDNQRSMTTNKELFELILKDKQSLLSIDNPVEFIFSHSALGVGWDNPNVFNIATLNHSYSEIKKRQEIGRGLRISVNQQGQRVYDLPNTQEGQEINLLTVIPNESYESFISQYQSEIIDSYGTIEDAAKTRHNHKGQDNQGTHIKRNESHFSSDYFRQFWQKLAIKTEYLVQFDEQRLIEKAIVAINNIVILAPEIRIVLNTINISVNQVSASYQGNESKKIVGRFSAIDLIKEISDKTLLAYSAVFKIIRGIDDHTHQQIINNPPRFVQTAIQKIHAIALDEMLRAVSYRVTNERFDLQQFERYIIKYTPNIEPTPNKGIYDYIVWDSQIEQRFAREADLDQELICFLKLPRFYTIKTPVGNYNPDFGLVFRNKKIHDDNSSQYYIVVETKGTNELDDRTTLTENEIYKIHCATKHFKALGIEAKIDYHAPIKEYTTLKDRTR